MKKWKAAANAAGLQASLLERLQSGERVFFATIQSTFSNSSGDGTEVVFHATKNNHPRIVVFPQHMPGMLLLLGKHSFNDDTIGFKWLRACLDIEQVTVQEVEKSRQQYKKFGFTFRSQEGDSLKETLLFEQDESDKFIQALKVARSAYG